MKCILILSAIVLLSGFLTGCASSGYFADRGRDAADILTLTAGEGIGAKVRIGAFNLSAPVAFARDWIGLCGGEVFTSDYETGNIDLWILVFGVGGFDTKDPISIRREKESSQEFLLPGSYQSRGGSGQYTQLEILLGLIAAIRVGFNPGELLDFVLGWTTIDIYDDDVGVLEKDKDISDLSPESGVWEGMGTGPEFTRRNSRL